MENVGIKKKLIKDDIEIKAECNIYSHLPIFPQYAHMWKKAVEKALILH
jgi:hypothetical protein